jgi:predicted nuclease of predicted toxin-antitoxin system
MRLFIDEDSVETLLLRLLRQAGHDLLTTFDAGLAGEADARQLTHAVNEQRVLLTHNHDDYEDLHLLIRATGGVHPGILVVRKDNDPRRDMTPRGIVNAIAKLDASGSPIANEFNILNH